MKSITAILGMTIAVLVSMSLIPSQGQAIPRTPFVIVGDTPTSDDESPEQPEDNTSDDTPTSGDENSGDVPASEDVFAMCEGKCASLSKQCNAMCTQSYVNDPGKIAICASVCNVIFNSEKNQCEQTCAEIANSASGSCPTSTTDDNTASDSEGNGEAVPTDEQKRTK